MDANKLRESEITNHFALFLPLFVPAAGHRGLGRSYRDDVLDQAEIRENTLLSFSEAGKGGAEYVELDVMLTKDRVPVIFHDFDVGIHGANYTHSKQALAIHIKDLTLHQLKTLYTTGTDSTEYK